MKFRQIVKMIEDDGWYHDRTKGSHKQFKHSTKPGVVTIAGKPNEEVPKGTLNNILKQARLKNCGENLMEYVVIFEKGENNYGAYAPDLPGCGVVGETLEEVRTLIAEAIEFHIEGLRESGEVVPQPSFTPPVQNPPGVLSELIAARI